MNAMLQHNQLNYQRQLLQGALQDLALAKQNFMNYRGQVSLGYDAHEMHYIMVSINEVLQQMYTISEDAQYLLEQIRFVGRSVG